MGDKLVVILNNWLIIIYKFFFEEGIIMVYLIGFEDLMVDFDFNMGMVDSGRCGFI